MFSHQEIEVSAYSLACQSPTVAGSSSVFAGISSSLKVLLLPHSVDKHPQQPLGQPI
jgi:hypothetical protein